jgi:RHS repeat-associated protein
MRIRSFFVVARLLRAVTMALIFESMVIPSAAVAATVAGRTPTTFTVTSTGATSYTIPLWAPPGVGDVQLNLALGYNSRSPNNVLGVGWSISGLSAITRCNKTFTQDGVASGVLLAMSDRFCLDGKQLKLTSASGTYGQAGSTYATEIESFAKIEASGTSGNGPTSFKVTSKNGLIYEYGLTADARLKPGGGATVRTWALSRIRDRVGTGNKITFLYTNDTANNTYRISSIAYPTTASGQGPFYEVLFAYAARPTNDIPSSYVSGFLSREPNRLTTITIRNFGSTTATKRYNLSYGQGTATNRSRLTSIQECSPTNCLPATAIVYQNGTAGWSSTLSNPSITTSDSLVSSPIPIDLNGDGLTDLFYPKVQTSSTSRWWAALATATGFQTSIDTGIVTTNTDLEIVGAFSGTGQQQILLEVSGFWTLVQYNTTTGNFTSTSTGVPAGTEYAAVDYDGDGLPDLASVVGTQFRVRRNTTVPPGAVTFSGTPETIFTYTGGWNIAGGTSYWLRLSDYNGDGRGDLYFLTHINTGFGNILQGEVLLSNGFGNQATNSSHLLSPGWTTLPGDWNADGCTDIIGSTLNISDCAGGFTRITGGAATANSILATDWDGDSRSDLLYVNTSNNTWYFIRSTGEAAAAAVSTGIAAPVNTAWFVLDKDGDGLLDAAFIDFSANNAIKYRLHNGATVPPDLATSFTDGVGINASPSYKSIARSNYTKHSNASFPEQDFEAPLYVVGDVTASDGTGGTYTQTFHYYGARFHARGRGFEGFHSRRTLDSRNGLYTYNYFARAFPHTGMLTGQTVSQGSDEISEWTGVPASQTSGGSGFETRKFPFFSSATQSEYQFGGPLSGTLITERAISYTYGDGFGNTTTVVTSTTDRDSSSPFYNDTWETTVETSYENVTASNCLGLPLTTEITNVVPGQTTRTRTFAYANNTSLCRLREEIIEPNVANLKVTSTLSFDADCGNLESVQVKGSKSDETPMPVRPTTIDFGSRCQLPERVTNALGQETRFTYFYNFGNLASVTDPNSFLTEWTIDDFGRRTREDQPDGTAIVWTYARCATPPCWGAADLRLRVTEDYRDTANVSYNTRQLHYDGMDRLRSDQTNRVLGVWTINDFIYDPFGRLKTQSQPYSTTVNGNGYFNRDYDEIGRLTALKLFRGNGDLFRTTTYDYVGRTTSITDNFSRVTQYVHDVLGRLRRVIDPAPGGTTQYAYDAFGNLNKITDPNLKPSTGFYNLRGAKTKWVDADRGTWNFTSNSLNEPESWTNAKGQTFSAEHDLLGRLTKRIDNGQQNDFVWGASAVEGNIGRLKSKTGGGYTEELFYDGVGRLANLRITTDQVYNYDFTYNNIGGSDYVYYPTSPTPTGETAARFKTRTFYSFGNPYRIRDVTQSGLERTLWEVTDTNAYSSPLAETLGPALISVTSGYKAWTNEMTSMTAGVAGSTTNRQNLSFAWNSVGNLTQRQDLSLAVTETFEYDDMDRIDKAFRNGVLTLDLNYDPAGAGRIDSKSDVGSYTYGDTSHPNAVTAAGTNYTFTYDANGNVQTRNGLTQTWTAFDLPATLQANIGGTTYSSQFSYGPDHQRWRQIATYLNGTETTHYVGGLLEKANAQGVTMWRHYVPTPTGLTIIVSRNSDHSKTTTYALSDHLGSSDVLLDNNGDYVTRVSFDVFGKRRGSDWNPSTPPDWPGIAETTRRGFTFHEMLDNIDLVHMNGRVYDPTIGRFMSVDPIIGNLTDSQSVNPYAYVGNRPLNYIDPSGFDADDPGGGDIPLPGCGSYCDPNGNDGSPGTWDWWGDVFDDVGDVLGSIGHFFGDLFGLGSGPPPPPPAISLPGVSSQNGVNMCDGGLSSGACGGSALGFAIPYPWFPPPPVPGADPNQKQLGELVLEGIEMLIEEAGRQLTVPKEPESEKDKKSSRPVSASDQTGDPSCGPDETCDPEFGSDNDRIDQELARLEKVPGKKVRVARSAEDLEAIYGRLSRGGEPYGRPTYKGRMVRMPDGSLVGIRNTAKSTPGRPTIDIHRADGRQVVIHIE